MASPFEGLNPQHLWKHFAKILTIPHCSGNERPLGGYVLSVAKELGLRGLMDRVGNVLVSKPASAGREKSEGIILQGHLDMVGEKNSDVVHDFAKDPIQVEVRGEWVHARGTTLGADNGIGVAACLAVMEDDSLVHGPLEFLFTVDEETGLTGANKVQKGSLKGKNLLNLDSEDEGTFTIGCAGGADSVLAFPVVRKKTAAKNLYRLKLTGFRGGHSGLDINQGRGNAVKLLARVLREAAGSCRFDLVSLEGGNKHNAIPREAWAVLACLPTQVRPLAAAVKKSFENIRVEYKAVEGDARHSLDGVEGSRQFAMTAESQRRLLDFILAVPHGVIAMHPEIKGLVETSTNLAIIRTSSARVEIVCSSRSSIASALDATRLTIQAVVDLAGARINLQPGYPGWMPDLTSPLLKRLREIYQKTFGTEVEVVAVHAGLECGIIGEKFPGMKMISFGPTIKNPHSPEERVQIPSVEKFWKFLTTALAELG